MNELSSSWTTICPSPASTLVTVRCAGHPSVNGLKVIAGSSGGAPSRRSAAVGIDRPTQPGGQRIVVGRRLLRGEVERRHEVLPHQVEHRLHVLGAGEHRHHRVVLGQHDHVLTERAVAAVAVLRHPQLEAVALLPIRLLALRVGDVHRRRVGDPPLGQQPATVPHAVVEVQLTEPGDGVEVGVHAGEAHVETGAQLCPAQVGDADRVEDARPQVVDEPFAGQVLQDRRQGDHRRLVVGEQRARLGVGRDLQEAADGVGAVDRQRFEVRLPVVTGGHRGDVPDLHPARRRVDAVEQRRRQVIAHQVVERQAALAELQPERGAGERLAQRVHEPAAIAGVWRPGALDDPPAVAVDDQPVRLDPRVALDTVEEGGDPTWIDALCGWAAGVHRPMLSHWVAAEGWRRPRVAAIGQRWSAYWANSSEPAQRL